MSMKRTYTETYDMNTEKDCPTLLGIHTPIGPNPRKFLEPCFRLYKKYKYLGCDITIVNAARLPVDPEQVGKIEGENYVDPRDTLNPVMFKGCHGESLGKVLDSMYGGLASAIFKDPSIDKEQFRADLEHFYYTALGDDSWRKSPIQKTLNIRGLHPLVYGLATQHQIAPTNNLEYYEYAKNVPAPITPTEQSPDAENGMSGFPDQRKGYGFNLGDTNVYDPTDGTYKTFIVPATMFTNKTQRLGWMDTLQFIGNQTVPPNPSGMDLSMIAQLPKVFMGLLLLPPSYLCRQYLRVIIRHKFVFAQYRSITTAGIDGNFWNPASETWGYANEITGNVPTSPSGSSKASGSAQVSPAQSIDGGIDTHYEFETDDLAEREPDESE